jgi:hypothetical protein
MNIETFNGRPWPTDNPQKILFDARQLPGVPDRLSHVKFYFHVAMADFVMPGGIAKEDLVLLKTAARKPPTGIKKWTLPKNWQPAATIRYGYQQALVLANMIKCCQLDRSLELVPVEHLLGGGYARVYTAIIDNQSIASVDSLAKSEDSHTKTCANDVLDVFRRIEHLRCSLVQSSARLVYMAGGEK